LRIAVPGDGDNAARHAFNEALRERYATEPLFDLAGFEAMRADGSRSTVAHGGRRIPTLAAEHTDDGGHLNAGAQRAAAAAFLETLAAALNAPR
jgi:lysophospholipase L1-like esterase